MVAIDCPQCGAPAPAPPERVCGYCRYQFPVAAGAHAADGFGVNWLIDRANDHLRGALGAQIAPAIDLERKRDALGSYARGALPDEPIVALYAPSPSVGWALTQRGFYWSTLQGPRAVAWRSLTPEAVVHMHPSLTVHGVAVYADDSDVARPLAALLRLLAASAVGLPAPASEAPRFSDETLLAQLRAKVGAVKSLHYAPDVPREKEDNARAAYRAQLHPAERVIALYDATWFGAGDEGWLLTTRAVYGLDVTDSPACVELAKIVREGVRVSDRGVDVQMKISLPFPDEQRAPLAEFFRALAQY